MSSTTTTQKRLTAEQQRLCEQLVPHAFRIARDFQRRDWGNDEYESIAMEALCDAVLKYEETKPADTPREFVCGFICNRLKNYARRRRRERGRFRPLDMSPEPTDREADDPLSQDDSLPGHVAAVSRLPADLQPFARLAWLEGMGMRQIAEELGVSLTTVSRRLKRACWIVKTAYEKGTFEELGTDTCGEADASLLTGPA
jgi:RNA polymerase sigma factor (sigma-70 family)